MVYLYLFISAFLSATLLPMGSEALLIYDINKAYNIYALIFVASVANTLGSVVNYFLGLKGEEYLENKRYLKQNSIRKYKLFFKKYGFYALFLSWIPIIGDPITLIAGVLKYNFKKFIFFVFLAKTFRYIFVALTTLMVL